MRRIRSTTAASSAPDTSSSRKTSVAPAERGGTVAAHQCGVARCDEPPRGSAGHSGGPQPFDHRVTGEEVLLHKGPQRAAQLVLPGRDQGGVGDRQPQRMAEQRGDGEPVGQPADHRGLGRRPEIAPAGVVILGDPRPDEHDGRGEQQSCRARLHPSQIAPPLRFVSCQHHLRHVDRQVSDSQPGARARVVLPPDHRNRPTQVCPGR